MKALGILFISALISFVPFPLHAGNGHGCTAGHDTMFPELNPVPRLVEPLGEGILDISDGVSVKDRKRCYGGELSFLKKNRKGPDLFIDYGPAVSERYGLEPVSGAYAIEISDEGITIAGYDDPGAFYGIQTFAQIAGCTGGKLPFVSIRDWPDMLHRGVVEGFYGTPWSHATRLALIDFYGKYKLNTYLYGPKDDPYHRTPDWRKPYPAKEESQIRELVDACRRNRVDFVWALHPGMDIKWNEEDYGNVLRKLEWMYALGVRNFAVFFDDISGEGADPRRQAELLNRLTEEFVKKKGDVAPLILCPTDYSRLWANPTPQGSLAYFGEALDPSVNIFWTGDAVCSDLTPETMEWVNSRIRRPAYFWWNYPVTDYVREIIMQGPVYGLDTTLTRKDVYGILLNPMEHGMASRIAMYGVADYAWNMKAYEPLANWERALEAILGDAAGIYRTFAIHSCDTETGYRRDESWETRTYSLAGWSREASDALKEEFREIELLPALMEEHCGDSALMEEIRPWLVEFGRLGTRGRKTAELTDMYCGGYDDRTFWNAYAGNLMDAEDRAAYASRRSGTLKLQPFYENAMADMAHGFLLKLTGRTPADYRGIGTFANSMSTATALMLDRDTSTFYTSAQAQRDGDWIGLDLRETRPVYNVRILQGRNSEDDVDYFDHAVLEYSEDAEHWVKMGDEVNNRYEISWDGDTVQARYIRLRRLPSERKNYAAVRSFDVNVTGTGPEHAAFDFNPQTFHEVKDSMEFMLPEGSRECVVLMGKTDSPVLFRQWDAAGNPISVHAADGPYLRCSLTEGAVKASIVGNADVYEVVVDPLNAKPQVIPEVKGWNAGRGFFVPGRQMRIVYSHPCLENTVNRFARDYALLCGFSPLVEEGRPASGDIAFILDDGIAGGPEGYMIEIGDNAVASASTPEGVRWAAQTLLQISGSSKGGELPAGVIEDAPDYGMRGFVIDCGRKFIPMDYLRGLVRTMSYYKMNVLHIHLNDNGFKKYFGNSWDRTYSAFRLECDTFPGLAARDGHYTKDEFRDFLKTAAEFGVTVIPEIDAPAHTLAFTQYRPELGSKEYGMDHLDLSNPEVYAFMDALWKEYLEGDDPVFSGPAVHIGTDEYSNESPEAVEQFRAFADHYIKYVESFGKQACMWGSLTHAAGDTPVKSDDVIMYAWYNGYADPVDMADKGYRLVSIPDGMVYIVPAAGYYHDYLNIEYLYENWTPAHVGDVTFPERDPSILGGMFALWNDHVGNGVSVKDIHYRVFPALQVIAAKTWNVSPVMPYSGYEALAATVGEAPGVNMLARPEEGPGPVYRAEMIRPGMELPVKEIGYDYTVTFTLEAAEEEKGTELFRSSDAVFYLSDPVSGFFGFARDGYLNTFDFRPYPGEKLSVKIVGTSAGTSLYIDGRLVSLLDMEKLYFNGGSDTMNYLRTLVFPLEKAGNFKSRITDFEVTYGQASGL